MVPEAKARLDLLSKFRQGSEIAPHEAHDLPQSPHTVLGLTHCLCGPCNLLGPTVERRQVEPKSHALFAVLADISLPVGAIAPHEQASIHQTGNVPACFA